MKIIIYKKLVKNFNNLEFIIKDNKKYLKFDNNEISCNDFSYFFTTIIEYILYYKSDDIWSYEKIIENNNYYIIIKLNVTKIVKCIKRNLYMERHEYFLYLLGHSQKFAMDTYDDDWKNAYIPKIEMNNIMMPEYFKIQLFNYQLKTLNWMQYVEKNLSNIDYELLISLYSLVKKYNVLSDKEIIKLKNIKIDMINKKVYYKNNTKLKMEVKGAILADEMGLGKTITMISLMILNNLDITNIKTETGRFKTKANLVICPNHLAKQWMSEIKKACPILKSILCLTKSMHENLTYRDIIEADVVIVSFQFLLNTKYYLSQNTSIYVTISRLLYNYWRNLKEADLQNALLTINSLPLESQLDHKQVQFEFFDWHRIIIDEGHEIFGNMTFGSNQQILLGNILLNLRSRFNWFVSGTPFINYKSFENTLTFLNWKTKIYGKNYNYGSISKLGINQKILRDNILQALYYRNTKESICNELTIPTIIEEDILLNFTELERKIYTNYKEKGYNNLYLRQLCCHPLITDSENNIYCNEGLSLEEVRQSLIKYNENKLNNSKKKLLLLKEMQERDKETNYKVRIKTVENKIRSFQHIIKFFSNIEPMILNMKDETCTICLCEFDNLVVTDCGHFYCKECIHCCLVQSNNKCCPMCRTKLSLSQIHPVNSIKNNKIDNLTLKYGTKMGKLIGLCRKLFNNKKNKIIIFSQWDRMLYLIKKTLLENDILTTICKGNIYQRNKAIDTFKKSKKIRIIMLSLKNAASGINLTEATHVILMDPIAGSKEEAYAIENQAIGRTCRIGQKNRVKVIRLLIKDTIEYDLYKRNYTMNENTIVR
jgi:SNF2 family DNA or RNA helicase